MFSKEYHFYDVNKPQLYKNVSLFNISYVLVKTLWG